ncbi:hypothetical protein [Lebetimonas sp. JS032]|uniref:hypothetical protein n=1 Tax=Lebetimonas sp. JS032 TaxID=990070 RepID=UPI0004660B39|nr:hypothetical protein [Lebetimonas sp. JS032]
MYNIDIEKRCGCVKKDTSLELPKTFKDKKEAEFEALKLANYMNANYCKKHRFFVNEEGNNFTICVELSCPKIS